MKIMLEDHGQDFLEWEIKNGKVVACLPFQGWLWEGTIVHNIEAEIGPGTILDITTKSGAHATLNYPVESIVAG